MLLRQLSELNHSVPETPTGVARALLYIRIRASPSFLLHPSYKSFYNPFPSSYEPGSQGIFIEKAFIGLFSYDFSLQVLPPSLPPAKRNFGGTAERQSTCTCMYIHVHVHVHYNVAALLRLPTIHRPATRCDPILSSS